jgi:hypothetical protein
VLCVGADGCVVGAGGGHVLNFKNDGPRSDRLSRALKSGFRRVKRGLTKPISFCANRALVSKRVWELQSVEKIGLAPAFGKIGAPEKPLFFNPIAISQAACYDAT